MSLLSIASRTPLQAERDDKMRKMPLFLPQIRTLKNNLPQSLPQIGLSCYTRSIGVRMAVSPIEGLEPCRVNLPVVHISFRIAVSPIGGLEPLVATVDYNDKYVRSG